MKSSTNALFTPGLSPVDRSPTVDHHLVSKASEAKESTEAIDGGTAESSAQESDHELQLIKEPLRCDRSKSTMIVNLIKEPLRWQHNQIKICSTGR